MGKYDKDYNKAGIRCVLDYKYIRAKKEVSLVASKDGESDSIARILAHFESERDEWEMVFDLDKHRAPLNFSSKNDANEYLWGKILEHPFERQGNIITASTRLGMRNRRGATGWLLNTSNKEKCSQTYAENCQRVMFVCEELQNDQAIVFYKGQEFWDGVGNFKEYADGSCDLLLTEGLYSPYTEETYYMFSNFVFVE